ncbi:MAG: signal recognition particle protein [Acidobacteria bacterium]|nr:signal recognition particle protein [Acidobacteriota bacterium]MCZ6489654.1 signal recognition particle protein [Acidobacteriota bacterium]MCZ6752140.1 signal recognition particle protein [Acidobacteriota bacterium]
MFEDLTGKFQRVFKTLRGEGKLTEENIGDALRQIRVALLEADVNFKVVKQLIENIRAKAVGQEVLSSFSPTEQVIKIVRDELLEVLGGDTARMKFASQPPSVFLLTGLQGSGKTTTAGKIARWLQRGGHHPLLVSVDVYRPAARQQLAVVAKEVGVPVFEGSADAKPSELALGARQAARDRGCDVLVVDTAGRLHVDDEMMTELQQLRDLLQPTELLFVADAMTGQDAVRSAEEFHRRLSLTGVVLTKLDGDARGGAALSIRFVTGQPIQFVGTGEKFDALEQFHPDRMVSRILGMGDVLSLIEKAEEVIDSKQAEQLERKLRTDSFTLEDFRDQLRAARQMGPLDQILSMLPQVGPFRQLHKQSQQQTVDEGQLIRTEAIINSMTDRERRVPQILNGRRRLRIARGSGTSVQEVNRLVKQYDQARKMMRSMTGRLLKKQRGKGKVSARSG